VFWYTLFTSNNLDITNLGFVLLPNHNVINCKEYNNKNEYTLPTCCYKTGSMAMLTPALRRKELGRRWERKKLKEEWEEMKRQEERERKGKNGVEIFQANLS